MIMSLLIFPHKLHIYAVLSQVFFHFHDFSLSIIEIPFG